MELSSAIFSIHFLLIFTGCSSQNQAPVILRLNSSGNSGVLQKYNPVAGGGTWLNFCYNTLQTDTAVLSVICQSLGFNSNSSQMTAHAIFSRQTRTVEFYSLRCTGTETDLSQCTYSESTRTYCAQVLNVTCPMCEDFQVRLSNGLDQHQGMVEICSNGSWHHSCSDNWGYTNSFVLCRELGFPASHPTDMSYNTNMAPQFSSLGVYPYQFNCYGNETSLGNCDRILRTSCRELYNIGYLPYVNVWCSGNEIVVSNCTPGDIRLIGGMDRYEGVVQICNDGLWGSFSYNSYWNYLNSRVACRQLGLLQHGNASRITREFIRDFGITGPIYKSPSCSGSETRLEYCPFTNFGSYINQYHSNDVAIRCHPTSNPVTTCINGDVRLVGGPSANEGRLELCYNGVWGSICGTYTPLQTSTVVCRQLGFDGTNHTLLHLYNSNHPYGAATGPIYFSYLPCRGYESNLLECERLGINNIIGRHSCSHYEDIAVICDTQPPPPPCQEGSIRLTGGYTPTDGHAQFCVNGQWLSSCTTNWNSATSDAFCRILLQRTNVASTSSSCCTRNSVLQSRTSLNFTCGATIPTASLLHNCPYSLVTCSSAIIIQCYVHDYCTEDVMRLYGGTSSTNGVLQICREGVWGNIAAYVWSTYEAELACRQLGLPTQWAHAHYLYSGYSYDSAAPFFITNLNCRGNETNLLNCSHRELSLNRTVNYHSPVGIICQDNQTTGGHPPCDSGSLRLGNFTDDGRRLDGRIEVCAEGTWTTLCDRGSSNYSSVVCRQLLGEPASGKEFSNGLTTMVHGNTRLLMT